jgi:hypothetical protein
VSRGALARAALVVVVALAAAPSTSCDVSDYCLNCTTGDGGVPGDGGEPVDGPDGGPPPDACVPTGVELCDGFDNDCNGEADDFPTDIGGACGDPDPPCTEGVYVCNAGVRECTGVEPTAEVCDDEDNNCNGVVDDGNPGGGGSCGTNEGECVAGINQCIAGSVQCIGASGTPEDPAPPNDPETDADCDGRDNDCDGTIDDGIVLGTCGITDEGECELGSLQCIGGGPVCTGAVGPVFELCDDLDQDCDGDPINGFDLMTDRNNCLTCGHVCDVDNATAACVGGNCEVGACLPGWHDANGDGDTVDGGDGCEYECDFQSAQEACNGDDDDCDGVVDEGVVPPTNFCRQIGACAGATAACGGDPGWTCDYPDTVSTDGMGNIVPESTCDGIDNDCDGPVDESHPQKNAACNDGEQGTCLDPGVFECDTADPSGPVVCNAVDNETMGTAETCNGLDDDCDGVVDNGHATGMMAGQEFVTVNGVTIMKYEASRPDATAAGQGTDAGWACSRPGALPWTNVTWPQAQDACEAIGARLCTEAEWEYTCSLTNMQQPVPGPTGLTDKVYLEAELGTISGVVAGRQFTAYSGLADYGGNGALQATPNSGTNFGCTAATQEANAPRIDFNVSIAAGNTGTYYIWMRTASLGGSDNSLCAGVDGTASTTTVSTDNSYWTWVASAGINVATAGTHRFSVYMREDGTVIDAIAISRSNATAPVKVPAWSYDVNPTTAQPDKCNTDPYDTNTSSPGDQDDVLPTGSVLTACYANGTGANDVFDLTGNVREWTAPRNSTVSALRGGASNTELNGATCQNDFVLGDDEFFFPNAGFRCCR